MLNVNTPMFDCVSPLSGEVSNYKRIQVLVELVQHSCPCLHSGPTNKSKQTPVVEIAGLEPAAPWSQTMCATNCAKSRYKPRITSSITLS